MLENLLPLLEKSLPLIGVIIGATLNNFLDFIKFDRRNIKDKQITAFYALSGLKITIVQQYCSTFEAEINHEMHKYNWQLEGCKEGSIDKEQMTFWMNKTNEKNELLAIALRELYEKLGSARIAFKTDKEICKLIDEFTGKPLYFKPVININVTNTEDIKNWGVATF